MGLETKPMKRSDLFSTGQNPTSSPPRQGMSDRRRKKEKPHDRGHHRQRERERERDRVAERHRDGTVAGIREGITSARALARPEPPQ